MAILNLLDGDLRYIKTDGLTPSYFGLDSQSIVGKSMADIAPQLVAKHGTMMQRIIATGESVNNLEIKGSVPSSPGEFVYWRTSWFQVPLPKGKRGLGIVGAEITDTKRAEEALRQSHEELQAIYDGMQDGLLVADIETKKFVRCNASMRRMLGYSEEEIRSRSVMDIHPADEVPNVLDRFSAIVEGRQKVVLDIPVLRKDGSVFYADIIHHEITFNGRHYSAGFFRDITERKQTQDVLERERRSLWHMLQASDHERQIISYEIHDGLAQYLAAAGMQFQAYDYLKENMPVEAQKAYETAVDLVRQAHAESRRLINEVRPPVIDEIGLETAIAHLVHEQQKRGGPKIECHSDVQFRKLPSILENALYRIVQEALTNACKHSKSRKVLVTLTQEGRDVRLEVRDWGIGFDAEAVTEGHFGLEGIRQRVRLLGGRLTIESKRDSGTLVQVVVPIVEKPAED